MCVLPANLSAQHVTADGAAQTFSFLTGQYFDDYFKMNPTAGTAAGISCRTTAKSRAVFIAAMQ